MENRLEKRAKILDLYGSSLDIFDVCRSIHSTVCGSCEPLLISEEMEKYIDFLEKCLDTWDLSYSYCEEYDNAVKNLVKATIKEAENYGKQ